MAKKKKFRELFKVIFRADLTTNPDYWFTSRRLVVHELLLGCTACIAVPECTVMQNGFQYLQRGEKRDEI